MEMEQDSDVVSRYGDLRNENAGAVIENPLGKSQLFCMRISHSNSLKSPS